MSDLSHETAEDGFHEIQLSGKQLVFLFIVTTSVVVGVFLFGVLVGRGAREIHSSEAAPAATTTDAAAPVAAAAAPPSEAPAPVEEEPLSYSDRLTNAGTPTEKLNKRGEDHGRPEAEPAPAPKQTAKSEPPVAPAAAKPPAAPAAAPRAALPAGIPTSGRPGTWLVQVIATREQGMATSIVQKLTAKGYPAFLVAPAAGAPQPFYKVQVGRYTDRGEAEKVSLRIKKEEQFQSWILR